MLTLGSHLVVSYRVVFLMFSELDVSAKHTLQRKDGPPKLKRSVLIVFLFFLAADL